MVLRRTYMQKKWNEDPKFKEEQRKRMREWYQKNKKKTQEKQKKYQSQLDADSKKAYQQEYYEKNKEKIKKRNAKYKKKHPKQYSDYIKRARRRQGKPT